MEGVSSASSVLQNAVSQIFGPMRDQSICIFDNILTGGDKEQLRFRTQQLLKICHDHNVRLNFKKSFVGHRTAKYFGYELYPGGYRIDAKRKTALEEIPFPDHGPTKKANTTLTKSLLGFSVYFSNFTENYAALAAPLHDMTRATFDWDKSTWTRDYQADFEVFKAALIKSMDLMFPDFSLTWILMTDASDFAVGWVLIQLRPTPKGIVTEVISVGSEKFSTQAELQWPINEKEAYGVLRGVESNSRLLYSKDFYICTDHWNLTYQENNSSKKLSRYLLVISQFPCRGQLPLKGDINPADYMSRRDPKDTQEQIQALRDSAVPPYNPSVPHVPTDVPISLSSFSTSTDRRHVRSFGIASALGVFEEEGTESIPDRAGDDDVRPTPADADTYQYDSICRECTSLCELRIPRRTFDWENATSAAQMFKFTVNGQVAFQGRLQSHNCMHDTDRGPCRSRAVFGAGHCWQHLLWRMNLRIKQSKHGRGLYAQRPEQSDKPVFKKGQTVIEYDGQELTADALQERYGTPTAPYAVAKHKGLVVDATLNRSAGSHANHGRRPNCRFGVNNANKVVIIAIRHIYNGDEILLNYNRGTGTKYLFDAPGVSYTTVRARLNTVRFRDEDDPSVTDAAIPASAHQSTPVYECIDPSNPERRIQSHRPIAHELPKVQYCEEQRSQMFIQCHSKKPGHWGAGKTWATLNKYYPGHGMSFSRVQTLVAECPKCQKYRISNRGLVISPKHTILQPPEPWKTVSLDGIPISPADIHGNNHCHISKEIGSNFINFYAASAKTEATGAGAIFTHRALLGPFQYLQTNPGSDYTSGVVTQVNAFLGVHHHIGMVGRPQSTGTERDVQEAKRFIKELCLSHTLQEHWSLPRILAVAQFLINEDNNEHTEFSPADLKFGRCDTAMLKIINDADPNEPAAERKSSYYRRLLAELVAPRLAILA